MPAKIVRRRYDKGLRNFFRLYMPLATSWELLDNSEAASPYLIAAGTRATVTTVRDMPSWQALKDADHG